VRAPSSELSCVVCSAEVLVELLQQIREQKGFGLGVHFAEHCV